MSDIVGKLPKMATMLRETPAHVLRGAGNLDVAATMMDEATETILALRKAIKEAEIHVDCASFRKAQDILRATLSTTEAK